MFKTVFFLTFWRFFYFFIFIFSPTGVGLHLPVLYHTVAVCKIALTIRYPPAPVIEFCYNPSLFQLSFLCTSSVCDVREATATATTTTAAIYSLVLFSLSSWGSVGFSSTNLYPSHGCSPASWGCDTSLPDCLPTYLLSCLVLPGWVPRSRIA